ncbi:unnamed protein product [Orchesella dallaii]|uniref:Uncharacterized protein n=1 Tax=Orchesella dallaii TaxID=48710 RepID=A0ABP1RBF6_9HEXA
MIFKNFLLIFGLLYPVPNLAIPIFPIIFDTSCFVRIVYDANLNSTSSTPTKISLPLQTNPTSETTISYMIQDVSNFSFAFDVEDILDIDQLTIFDGYFPFFSKHYKICDVFILLTDTFNSTIAAIQQSGYSNSDDATFFVVLDSSNGSIMDNSIIAGFLSDFSSLETVSFSPIYSNLAFVPLLEYETKSETTGITTVYTYCYHCPKKIHEIGINSAEIETISLSLSNIRSKCKQLNNNGWNTKAIMLVAGPPITYKGLLSNLDQKIWNDRKSFKKHLNESYISQYFLFRMALDQMNMSFDPNLQRYHADDEAATYWHLNIKGIRVYLQVVRNDVAATRGTFILTYQETFTALYCMHTSELVKLKWDIYFTVLDFPSWILIIVAILAYAFIYNSFSQAIDLAWILLDMEFWRRHPRKILVYYMLGAMFLHWTYDSGMSTDFIHFDFPIYAREMFEKGYRFWNLEISTGMGEIGLVNSVVPEYYKKFIQENSGVSDIIDSAYINYGYNFSENVQGRLKSMADKKLLLQNGVENAYTFPSLFMTLSANKKAVVEQEFVCGILHQLPGTDMKQTNSYLIRGYLSRRFATVFERFLESGLQGYIQELITLQSALKLMLRVDDLNAVLSSSTLGVRTPLGIVCAAYMALSFTFLLLFIGSIIYEGKVTAKIMGVLKLKWERNPNNVQIFEEEEEEN